MRVDRLARRDLPFRDAAVSSNCFVPSGRTVGARTCAPKPWVAAGNAEIESFIALSICSGVIDDELMSMPDI